MASLVALLTAAYVVVLVPLIGFGLHRGWLVVLRILYHRHPTAAPPAPEPLPQVTVQLPVYNERWVAVRALETLAKLDWPRDRFEIQVLDDSTDDTSAKLAACVQTLPADLRVAHLQRSERAGFKAGALAFGLRQARGELIAVFDADFVPASDFLRRAVPWFADPRVGAVQARWEHLNVRWNLLTRVQALLLDGHFGIEHPARAFSGCWFNFNGTAGVLRRSCLEAAGGWQADTLTEDLDLSYRAQLAGWRFHYLPELSCAAELPVDAAAFAAQQHRWAQGSVQTARKLLARVWRAPVSRPVKLEATAHLLGNLAFPWILAAVALALPLQVLRVLDRQPIATWVLWLEAWPLLASTASVLLYVGSGQAWLGRWSLGAWLCVPLVLAAGAGLCVNNSLAIVRGVRRTPTEFQRTPKHHLVARSDRLPPRPYRTSRGLVPWFELGLGLWSLATALLSWRLAMTWTAIFHGLFAAGLLWIGIGSLLAGRHPQRRAAAAA